MRLLGHLVGLAWLALFPVRAEAGLGPGDPAVFHTEAILLDEGLGELAAEDLAGKAVVLEFWATWCVPCIAELPRWNRMTETFAEEPVVFVSVTDEDEATVRPFLETRPLRGIVVLDGDRSLFEAYGATARPHTVLIDPGGTVQAAGFLRTGFSEDNLRALLAGEPLDIPEEERPVSAEAVAGIAIEGEAPATEPPLFQAVIRPSTSDQTRVVENSDERFAFLAMRPSYPYATTYRVASNRFEFEDGAELPEGKFDFLFHTPGRPDLLRPLLQQALEASFGVTARKEMREMDVFEFRVPEGATLDLDTTLPDPDTPQYGGGPGHMEVSIATMPMVAAMMENLLGAPAFDATGVKGPFRFVLDWDPDDPTSVRKALEGQLGIEVVSVRREVGFLVFRPVERLVDSAEAKP